MFLLRLLGRCGRVRQAIKRVNVAFLGLLLLQTACSQETVPTVDAIQAAYDRSDSAQARELARRALNANPADPRVILLNSQIAIESDSPDYAINALRPLIDDPQFGSTARPWLGRALVMSNQPAEAIRLFAGRAPTDGLSAAVLVVAYRAMGELDKAREVFAAGRASFPNAPDLLMIEAEEALRVGDQPHARAIIQKLVQIAPRKVDTQMLAARMSLIDGQADRAMKRLDWVLAVRPDHSSALLLKGSLLQDQGDVAQAEAVLTKAAKATGNAGLAAQYLRARLAFDKGDKGLARQLIDEIANPSIFPPAAQLAGILAAEAGQNDRAIGLLQRYVAGYPEDAGARRALARAFLQTGNAMEAWHYLEPAARAPDASSDILNLAVQLVSQLGLPNAAQWQARLQNARQQDARLQLFIEAEKLMKAKNWRGADQVYAQLLQNAPASGDRILLNNAAFIRQKMGDLGTAETLIRKALTLGTPDAIILDTASWILFEKYGATPEVRALSNRALKLAPNNPDVRAHAQKIGILGGE